LSFSEASDGALAERLGRGLSPYGRSPAGGQNRYEIFVYFLQSLRNNDLYVGSTENMNRRVASHNLGKVKSTKAHKPWKLLGFEVCSSRSEAVRLEKFYKTGQQKEILKKRFGI